jgi:hypothetical protein
MREWEKGRDGGRIMQRKDLINLMDEITCGLQVEGDKGDQETMNLDFKDNLIEMLRKLDLRPSLSRLLLLRIIIPPQTITTLNTPNHMSIRPGDLDYISNRLRLIIHPHPLPSKSEVSILRPLILCKSMSNRWTRFHTRSLTWKEKEIAKVVAMNKEEEGGGGWWLDLKLLSSLRIKVQCLKLGLGSLI